MLAVIAVMGVVCEEVNMGPIKEYGIFNTWHYYTGKLGTSSYKLDWDAFYKRRSEYAKTTRYRYIYVSHTTVDPRENATLSLFLYDGSIYPEGAYFMYNTKNGQSLNMIFSDVYEPMIKEIFTSYSDAAKAWNYYLDYM